MCEIGEVSRSGYYKWLRNFDKPDKDTKDYELIREIFEKGKRKLGWRSVQMRLINERKIIMNHKKIQRIMRKYHLFVKIRSRNPYKNIAKKMSICQSLEILYYYLANYLGKFLIKSNVYFLGDCKSILV